MNIIWFKDCSYENKLLVGGKNASLGELYHLSKKLNFKIANGFAITTILLGVSLYTTRNSLKRHNSTKVDNLLNVYSWHEIKLVIVIGVVRCNITI